MIVEESQEGQDRRKVAAPPDRWLTLVLKTGSEQKIF
jgi:hypothetical protein